MNLDPPAARPQPVVNGVPPAPTITAASVALAMLGLHRLLDGWLPPGQPAWALVAVIVEGAIVAGATWLAAHLAARRAAAKVTPLESPRDADGGQLVRADGRPLLGQAEPVGGSG